MRRELAAVLAADVVGYSRLMSEDAEGTIETLRRLRAEIFGPTVAAKRGRVIKSMGDGWIVVFPSVSGGVEAVMHIQDRLKVDGAIQLRMGLHLGDVAEVDEDVFGDGVNIAARLQELAEPGAFAISGATRDLLDGSLKHAFDDNGPQSLKNIREPVHIWVRGGEIAAVGASLKSDSFPSITLLPVEIRENDDQLEEIAGAICSELAEILNAPRLVSARISETPRTGDYNLRMRLRAQGDRLRLETSLNHDNFDVLFSKKFDGALSNAFDWQDEVVETIAGDIVWQVVSRAAEDARSVSEEKRSAANWMMLAAVEAGASRTQIKRCVELGLRAVQTDPEFGYGYAWALAFIMSHLSIYGAEGIEDLLAMVPELEAAIEKLETPSSPAHLMLAFARVLRTGDASEAKSTVRTMLRRMPFEPDALVWGGWLHIQIGEFADAVACLCRLERGFSATAYGPGALGGISVSLLRLKRFEDALEYAERAISPNPDYAAGYRFKAAAAANLGQLEMAEKALASCPVSASISSVLASNPSIIRPNEDPYVEGLRKAGMPE